MKLKLIHTENNSFIVDVEAEPELKKDWCIDEINRPEKLKGKILYSLNKISDDIPLFEIVEDDVEKLAYKYASDFIKDRDLISLQIGAYLEGYNQAKATKGYSEEDLKKAYYCCDAVKQIPFEQYLQSLNQSKEQEVEIVMEEIDDLITGVLFGIPTLKIQQPKLTKEGKVQIKLK